MHRRAPRTSCSHANPQASSTFTGEPRTTTASSRACSSGAAARTAARRRSQRTLRQPLLHPRRYAGTRPAPARVTCRAICAALSALTAPSACAQHVASLTRASTALRTLAGVDAGDRQQRARHRCAVVTDQAVDQLRGPRARASPVGPRIGWLVSAARKPRREPVAAARGGRGSAACARHESWIASVKPPLSGLVGRVAGERVRSAPAPRPGTTEGRAGPRVDVAAESRAAGVARARRASAGQPDEFKCARRSLLETV